MNRHMQGLGQFVANEYPWGGHRSKCTSFSLKSIFRGEDDTKRYVRLYLGRPEGGAQALIDDLEQSLDTHIAPVLGK